MKTLRPFLILFLLSLCACSAVDQNLDGQTDPVVEEETSKKLLALGDSYTIGQSVCETCRFPEQLKHQLKVSTSYSYELEIIAQTGWTSSNLIGAMENASLPTDYDLVTLLIGVNNQYQSKPFSLYTSEFATLVQKAITAAQGDKDKVIVISIPDYAYTPFGQNTGNPVVTSSEIDDYNTFAQNYCNNLEISYVYITDITRLGLEQPALVASDGLHPSELAYFKFVERLLPVAIEKLH